MNTDNIKQKTNYGEPAPYDLTFSGPVYKRSFTDVMCCLIFVAAVVGYVIIGGAAWFYGNPQYIIKQQNSAGTFCGVGPNFDKPNLFYFDVLKCASADNVTAATFKGLQCPTTQVCIKKCPTAFWFLPPKAFTAGAKPAEFFQQEYCDPSLDLTQTTFTVQEILDKGLCPAYYMPSKPVLGKCLPSFEPNKVPSDLTVYGSTLHKEKLKDITAISRSLRSGFNAKSMTVKIIEDFAISWYWILVGLVIALAISRLFLMLMQCCVTLVVIFIIAGLLSLGAYGIYQCYQGYEKHINSQLTLGDLSLQSELSDYFQVKEIWLACLVTVSLLEFLFLVLLVSYLRRRLAAALAMMRECSVVMGLQRYKSTRSPKMAYPLVPSLLIKLCVTICIVTSINLATSGLPVYRNTSNPECNVLTGEEKCLPETFKASKFPVCCAFDEYDEEKGFFQRLMYNLRISHLFEAVWIVLEFFEDMTRGGQRCSCCCFPLTIMLKCFLCALDTVIKYIKSKPHVKIAVHVDTYSILAKNAYTGRKKDRVLVVNKVTDLLMFFGRLLVAGAMGVLAFYFFNGDIRVSAYVFQADLLNYWWLPVIVVMVGAYFVAQCCFSVYSMGVNTFNV